MSRTDESTPVSPVLEQLFGKKETIRKQPVNKRVFYLSIQAVINAIFIGLIAKLLVALIAFITNFAFYGTFSLKQSFPDRNNLGWFVIFIPIAGSILVGLMARYGSKAIRGQVFLKQWKKLFWRTVKFLRLLLF